MSKKRSIKEPWALYFTRLDKLYLKLTVRDIIQVIIKEAYIYNNISPDIIGTRKRKLVDTNAVIDTSRKVIDNVRDILRGCRGYLPYVQGKYRLVIETTGSASESLGEDDIIGGYALASPT